jgi:hypothetical protein
MEKTFNNTLLVLGALLLSLVVGVGIHAARTGAWIDYAPKEWLSDDDKKTLKDPAASVKEEREKFGREAYERYQKSPAYQMQQPQNWNQNWKK